MLLLCLWPWPPWPLACCWLCCCSRGPLQPLQPCEARAGSWEVRATTAACQLCEPPDRLLAFAIFTPLASQPRSIGNILARSLHMISLARAGCWEARITAAACQLHEPPDRCLGLSIFTLLKSQPRSIGNILARSLNMISLAMIQLDFTSKMVRGWKLISCSWDNLVSRARWHET